MLERSECRSMLEPSLLLCFHCKHGELLSTKPVRNTDVCVNVRTVNNNKTSAFMNLEFTSAQMPDRTMFLSQECTYEAIFPTGEMKGDVEESHVNSAGAASLYMDGLLPPTSCTCIA
jgi:hypothetical protein